MEKREKQFIKTIGLLAVLLLTFGITYLDFEDLSFQNNIRPYLEIGLGIISVAYLFTIKRKYKNR